MVEEDLEEEEQFPADEMDRFLQEICEDVLKDCVWDESIVPHRTNLIIEKSMKALINLGKPYKWAVTCVMQQKI